MEGFWGIVIGVLGALTGLGSLFAVIYKSRNENKNAEASAKALLDARIDERVAKQLEGAWADIDTLKSELKVQQELYKKSEQRGTRRDGAITRILRDIARQWPNAEGPNLNPADIAEIEETIPTDWIRKTTEAN